MHRSLRRNLAIAPLLFVWLFTEPGTGLAAAAAEGVTTEDAGRVSSSAPGRNAEHASKVAEAERLAARAFDAYGRKDYPRALALYQAALAAAKSADILYNIARVYDVGLHQSTRAIEYYQRYVAEPKAQPSRRELAQRRLSELKAPQRAASPANLSSAAPPSVLPPPALPAGSDLSAPEATAALSPSTRWTWRETTAAALAGSGVVALGVGIGFGVAAYSRGDDWRRDCDGNSCTSQRAVDAARSAARSARAATVALGAGGALLAGGAAVWWIGSKREESSRHLALRLAPTSGGAEVGCSLSGSF